MESISEKEYLGLRYDDPRMMLDTFDWFNDNLCSTIGYVEKEGEDINMFSIKFKDLMILKQAALIKSRSEEELYLSRIKGASDYYITSDGGQTIQHKFWTFGLEYISSPFYEPITGKYLLEYRGGSIVRNGEVLTSLSTIEEFINENPECDQVPFRGLEFMFPSLVTSLIRREWIHTTEEIYQRWVKKCRIY